jgi:hypothetical protein
MNDETPITGVRRHLKAGLRAPPEPLDLDGRSRPARRYTALVSAIATDLGGAEQLSQIEQAMVRRFAFMALQCEVIEARALSGVELAPEDIERHGVMSDRLRRLGQTVGLERRSKPVDVMGDYLRRKARE